jgi:glycosyltransferase involved in cell wall biosynthesis
MKVLQINIVYDIGSTGKIVSDIHKQLLGAGHSSMVIYGQGSAIDDPHIIKVTSKYEAKIYKLYSCLSGYPYSGCFFSTNKILNIIANYKPDVVHLHVINNHFVNHYRLLNYLKTHNIFTVITLHAEFMYTGKCGHSFNCEKWKSGCGKCPQKHIAPKFWFFDRTASEWKRKSECYDGFNNLVIAPVSPWLGDRAKQSPFFSNSEFVVIGNGLDTHKVYHPTKHEDLRQKHGIKDEKILLHVTASFNDPFKGGKYILDLANRLSSENIKIIIVGYNGSGEVFPDNLIVLRHIKDQVELAKYYSLADLTILTSKRETYSMVCAESLSCGTPVIGFKAGAPEQISLEKYSEFVDYDDIDNLEFCIKNWIDKKHSVKDNLVKEASIHYSKEKMFQQYLSVYKSHHSTLNAG